MPFGRFSLKIAPVLLLAAPLSAVTIEEILARVQANTGQFEKSLPDFVCDEKITSSALQKGRKTEAVIESHFVGLQERSGKMFFTERREIVSVNGKPARPGERLKGPFLFAGGYSSLLDNTFSEKNVACHTYGFGGEERLGTRDALVIEFATRKGQKTLYMDANGKGYAENDTGKAWISKDTLQLLRLERQFHNVPKRVAPIVVTVEYGEVRIGDRPFWMPLKVMASEPGYQGDYLAEYTNYRKFEVSAGIVFEEK
jgi:hypothetical protein